MTNLGGFTPQQARETWETIKLLRSSGLLRNLSKISLPDDPGLASVLVHNDSGEEIPPFACLQVTGTEVVDDRTFLTVEKPDSLDGKYIFNHDRPIEIDGIGMALPWGVVRMLGDPPTIPTDYGPVIGEWTVEETNGGPFVAYGQDAYHESVIKGRIGGGSGKAELIEFRFPTPYEYDEVPTECDLRNTDGEGGHNVEVIKRPCGQATAAGEVDGYVDVIDDLGLLDGRDFRDLAGRKGIATRLKETGGLCEWVIVYVDFHREIQVVTDIVFSSNGLTIERAMVKVWDDCEMPPEEIEGADCTPDVEYY